jgi:hypothetical protein
MIASVKDDLAAELRALYDDSDVAKRFFDKLASRQKDCRMTVASRAADLAGSSHGQIIALMRRLDALGAGTFKVGRRTAKTRIEWDYSVRSLGAAAKGAGGQPTKIDPTQLDEEAEADTAENEELGSDPGESEDEWITHSFQLRADLRLTIKLPVDLTSKEADRLSGFIRQVPFND